MEQVHQRDHASQMLDHSGLVLRKTAYRAAIDPVALLLRLGGQPGHEDLFQLARHHVEQAGQPLTYLKLGCHR